MAVCGACHTGFTHDELAAQPDLCLAHKRHTNELFADCPQRIALARYAVSSMFRPNHVRSRQVTSSHVSPYRASACKLVGGDFVASVGLESPCGGGFLGSEQPPELGSGRASAPALPLDAAGFVAHCRGHARP